MIVTHGDREPLRGIPLGFPSDLIKQSQLLATESRRDIHLSSLGHSCVVFAADPTFSSGKGSRLKGIRESICKDTVDVDLDKAHGTMNYFCEPCDAKALQPEATPLESFRVTHERVHTALE